MKRLFFSILSAGVLSACATPPSVTDHPVAFVVRHFEKAGGSDPELSPKGKARAAALAARLAAVPIAAVYATDTRRAMQSAEPTSQRRSVPVQIYSPADYAALQRGLAGGSALIVGHSNTVPDIVAHLSGKAQPPMTESQYGDLFVVDLVTKSIIVERVGD